MRRGAHKSVTYSHFTWKWHVKEPNGNKLLGSFCVGIFWQLCYQSDQRLQLNWPTFIDKNLYGTHQTLGTHQFFFMDGLNFHTRTPRYQTSHRYSPV